MNKKYQPSEIEPPISKKWIDKKFFSSHDLSKKPFTILLPPPNVTGQLHIGHAFDTYLQDTILRYKKMDNYDVFYIAGMDHAGIATQSKVENMLLEKFNLTKHDLGRKEFIKKVWEWKDEYAKKFHLQWAALGLGLDYENERFTLDDKSNQAVNKAFIALYRQKLIYRGKKAINWDTKLKTAISNIEVINRSIEQEMLYIKYPLKNSKEYLVIATVRPETMLSDVAVVYNPSDKRYSKYQNKTIIHPLTNKEIPIISDEYIDINFGTGLMKLSAHAEIDIELIQKHNLEINETIDKNGFINYPNSQFDKLSREEARLVIKNYLKENNLIEKIEKVTSNVGYSERSNTPIEILVMPQWFVRMEQLSKMILKHLHSYDAVKFYPSAFIEHLKHWMNNVHDWTISRQLWWGHQIPAWYKNNEIKVQIKSPGKEWKRDEDVLDTWFSSGLAPFSFLGWPSKNNKLERYFPTSLLVTGFDIIFFWIARMYFFSLKLLNKKPFEKVLIHGLIRDKDGRKMSKSLNNGVDPIEIINKYGSDSLRWFLITNSTPGFDINFSEEGVIKGWAICNKLWNIANFIQALPNEENINPADEWMRDNIHELRLKVNKFIDNYEMTIIGAELEKFINETFSSKYIEVLKVAVNKKKVLTNFKKLLVILHPFLPFITDYLYKEIFQSEILEQTFAKVKMKCRKRSNHLEIITAFDLVNILRKYREKNNISKKEIIYFSPLNKLTKYQENVIFKLANCSVKENKDFFISEKNLSLYVMINDNQKEKYIEEINKKISFTNKEILRAQNILNNENFIKKAAPKKIEEEQNKLKEYQSNLRAYQEELKKIMEGNK
ncbi:Valyl-tRNA synthetase [Mycoplasmopsis meleagridis]|uniref:Valine--tRNA ligase n=1 Tax=Mycoplasmopsis meleagridis ATCC 25294 TaxID=1264554 RepID=A0A0F5H0T1_9BACT|nr:valine--tRNA ligase [Mycoplasmopsis meleagridis]KKB26735.1 Valyl-tRNA synthetase [Mycoplasmopsis meleagridis ATCC 25294]OAD18149.1 Valyl-tRNA synthetase [Mycoplasmopsis meleagridis]VEU77269.1 Valine--tRNA ligase [Mycoplasmopsis meleagridis]